MEKKAIGFIETIGLITLIAALDEMLKSSDVDYLGCRGLDGIYTGSVSGDISAVRYAVDVGVKKAEKIGVVVASKVINAIEEEINQKLALTKNERKNIELGENNNFLAIEF